MTRFREGPDAGCGEAVEATGPATACGRAVFERRREHALGFETVEGGIDGAGRNAALAGEGDVEFTQDGATVGLVLKAEDGEEDEVLECAEELRHVYKVGLPGAACKKILPDPYRYR